MEFCPQCQERVKDIYLNRLVQDACGHKKCRKCLLNEEHGCRTCSESRVTNSVFTPYRTEMSDTAHAVSPTTSNDLKITTLENAVPYHSDFQERGCEQTLSPVEVATKLSIPQKKKLTPKKDSTRSNASKCKVKRKPLLIPGYVTISDSTPKFTCTLCNKSFTTRLHIRYHTYCDGLAKPFKCGKCDREFITKSHYQYHLRNHEGSRPYVCSECGKSFNQQGKLTRHSRSHLEEKAFVCSTCGHRFKNLDGLTSHTKIHTGIKAHHCTLCKKQFSELANLKKHLITHKGEKNFMCDECGKSFGSKSTLNTHVHTHSKVRPHICNACGRAFSLRKDLKRHETTHLSLKPFNCQLCNQAFRRRDNFDRHMKNTHPESTLPPIIKPLPKISSNEKPPVATSEDQTKEAIHERIGKMDTQNCVSENVKNESKSRDIEGECDAAETKTHLKQPDYRLKKLDNFYMHTANNVPKSTAVTETLESGSNSKAAKLDVRNEYTTQNDPTSQTIAAKVTNDSPAPSAVYQAVPVINRTKVNSSNQECNITTSSIIKMGSSLARTSYDGTNCVRTITCTSNAQMTVLPSHSHETGTAVNVAQTEKAASAGKGLVNQDQCNSKEVKPDSVPVECPPKPKLRLYLSDLHWRKRTMELLNLRNELKADSLVYDKSLEKVDDMEEDASLINPVAQPERIEFCNSPKNNNSDDHGTYYSKQTFYTVSDQPGAILVKGTQQKYLPHNRLRHIHPKSIVYHDPRPQTSFQRTQAAETGAGLGHAGAPVYTEMQQRQQHATPSQAKNVIVENKIGNVRPAL